MRVYLGLGANLGNRLRNLQGALALLSSLAEIRAVASLYQSPAAGPSGQQPYWNSVVQVDTALDLTALLAAIKRFEHVMGRRPARRWDSRPLDIDILLAGAVSNTADLVVPHPRLAERDFVLAPLAEVAADVVHPVLGVTLHTLHARIASGTLTEVAGPEWVRAAYLREPSSER